MKDPRVLKDHVRALCNEYKYIIQCRCMRVCCVDHEGNELDQPKKLIYTYEEVDALLNEMLENVEGLLEIRLKLMDERINEG